jgi:hypothetical protein
VLRTDAGVLTNLDAEEVAEAWGPREC